MNRPRPTRKRREELKLGENLCEFCTAKCCNYFALTIDTPDSRIDFEYIRWYLLHDYATVFVEEETWYLLVHTTCKHLQSDHRCGIYEMRPKICRDYSNDNCEYEDDFTYDRYFETAEQIDEYAQAFFNTPASPGFRSLKPGLPIIYSLKG